MKRGFRPPAATGREAVAHGPAWPLSNHDFQSLIIWSARAGRSGATTFGCGSPAIGSGALPGRVIRPAARPALWAPIVSQTWQATMQQSDGGTSSSWATMW